MIFRDRVEAGEKLANKFKTIKNPVVLAIPRGGIVIGAEIAKKIGAPLDIIVARKLGAPGNPELAIGAVTPAGDLVLDEALIEKIGADHEYILEKQEEEMKEAKKREKTYRSGLPGEKKDRKPLSLKGKTVILTDDGLATGATMEVALRAVQREKAARVVIAIPVAPPETIKKLKKSGDEVVFLAAPESFQAIGQFYEHFPQVSDEEVIDSLKKSKVQN